MRNKNGETTQRGLGLVENAELPQYGRSVVVDFFSRQAATGVKGVHGTKREFDSPPGGGKAAPRAEMSSPNDDLEEN